MEKDFDKWNNQKRTLDSRSANFLFHPGEIWWCSVGLNIGMESCGKGTDYQRPVLVLKKLSRKIFIGLPISTQSKLGTWFIGINIFNEPRYVLLYQIRLFSSNRFQRRLVVLDNAQFRKVKEKLELLLEL